MNNNNDEKVAGGSTTPTPCEPPILNLMEIDRLYLKCSLMPNTFKNPTLQSFMNELHDVFEDIVQRGSLENHIDGHGYFTVSVKVEREE